MLDKNFKFKGIKLYFKQKTLESSIHEMFFVSQKMNIFLQFLHHIISDYLLHQKYVNLLLLPIVAQNKYFLLDIKILNQTEII